MRKLTYKKFLALPKKQLIPLLVALVCLFLGLNAGQTNRILDALDATAPGYYRVVGVNDGDTIVVSMNGQEEIIRLIGVDTPETHHPKKPVQCFGQAASNFTEDLLNGTSVRLEADIQSDNRDVYDRLLRYVFTKEGQLVNKQLIDEGYGFAYRAFPHSKLDEFIAAEQPAREQKRGLWSGCELEENQYGSYETQPAINGR